MLDICDTEHEFAYIEPLFLCLKHEAQWLKNNSYDSSIAKLESLVERARALNADDTNHETQVNTLLDAYYTDWAFSGTGQAVAASKLNSLAYVLSHHTGNSVSLGMVLNYLLQQVGLDSNIVVFEGEVCVQIHVSAREGYIIEPCSGQQRWYVEPENDDNQELSTAFQLIDGEDLVKLFIGHQKWAFIAEQCYGEAFICVEKMMQLTGDDPYERRDRGYLLQHLDCADMAKEDFEFFIAECPDDPSIELVQHQLDELTVSDNTFH